MMRENNAAERRGKNRIRMPKRVLNVRLTDVPLLARQPIAGWVVALRLNSNFITSGEGGTGGGTVMKAGVKPGSVCEHVW